MINVTLMLRTRSGRARGLGGGTKPAGELPIEHGANCAPVRVALAVAGEKGAFRLCMGTLCRSQTMAGEVAQCRPGQRVARGVGIRVISRSGKAGRGERACED